jgi:cell wall-active antibiotic response 4TMS protein YvqF
MANPATPRCRCMHCSIRGSMGPIVLITIGILFLIAEFSRFSFGDLWPVILIVIGVVSVLQSMASREGHTGS